MGRELEKDGPGADVGGALLAHESRRGPGWGRKDQPPRHRLNHNQAAVLGEQERQWQVQSKVTGSTPVIDGEALRDVAEQSSWKDTRRALRTAEGVSNQVERDILEWEKQQSWNSEPAAGDGYDPEKQKGGAKEPPKEPRKPIRKKVVPPAMSKEELLGRVHLAGDVQALLDSLQQSEEGRKVLERLIEYYPSDSHAGEVDAEKLLQRLENPRSATGARVSYSNEDEVVPISPREKNLACKLKELLARKEVRDTAAWLVSFCQP